MDNRWSVVGGIMSIVSGAFGVLGGLALAIFAMAFSRVAWWAGTAGDTLGPAEQDVINLVGLIYGVMGGFLVAFGILALIGGIFALRRKLWGLALAGAIGATICFFPIGVVAIVFTSMARQEFAAGAPPLGQSRTSAGP